MRIPVVKELTILGLLLTPMAAQARPDDDDPRGRGADAHERHRPEAIRSAIVEHVTSLPRDFDRGATPAIDHENLLKNIAERPRLKSEILLRANVGHERTDDFGVERKTFTAQQGTAAVGSIDTRGSKHAAEREDVVQKLEGPREVQKAGHGHVTTVREAARLSEKAKAALKTEVRLVDRAAEPAEVEDKGY
jgi:hypothetical protein